MDTYIEKLRAELVVRKSETKAIAAATGMSPYTIQRFRDYPQYEIGVYRAAKLAEYLNIDPCSGATAVYSSVSPSPES